MKTTKLLLLLSWGCIFIAGCTTPNSSKHVFIHPEWSDSQKELYEHFHPVIEWKDCTEPDFSDTSHTNFVLQMPNGYTVEMIWCPRGIVSVGEPIEDHISKLNGSLPYSVLKEGLNKSDFESRHHVFVKGFWISKTVFSEKDFKLLCQFIGNDNNDRIRWFGDAQGLTWNEAMLIGGVLERQAKNSGYISSKDNDNWGFRLPTVAELRYSALAGSVDTISNLTTNKWGIEHCKDYLWCYNAVSKHAHVDKQIFTQIVTNMASSCSPTTTKRIIKNELSNSFLSVSPYNMLMSPKARLVLAPDSSYSYHDLYMYAKVFDSVSSGVNPVFLNERILWAEQFLDHGVTWWLSNRPLSFKPNIELEVKQNLTDYISFMKQFIGYNAPTVSNADREVLLGYSLLVNDYVMFRMLTNLGTKKTIPSLPPAMNLAAAAQSTNYLNQLYLLGEKVNVRDISGTTPLHAAVAAEEKNNVEWLLSHGARTTATDVDGNTPYDIARSQRLWEIAALFENETSSPSQNSISLGTAFFVNNDTAITCNHVIDGHNEIWTETESGFRMTFSVIANDPNSDIAVLKVQSGSYSHTCLPLSVAQHAIADNIFTIGYPLPDIMGSERKYTEGTISALSGIGRDPRVYQISIPIQPGNSGGAVVSEEGVVIGLAAAALDAEKVFKLTGSIPQNVNYAIKSRYITAILQDNGIPYNETPPKSGTDTKTIVDQVSRATILLKAK